MKKIIILNGPNLNLLGEREKSQYGSFTLTDVEKTCKEFANKNNLNIDFFQSNIEGELIQKIQDLLILYQLLFFLLPLLRGHENHMNV